MALSAKKLQEVMKEKRRRDKLPPRPVLAELIPLTLKRGELSHVTDRCSTILLAIETTIVQSAREHSQVDDEIVRLTLACLIRQLPAESEAVALVASQLVAARQALPVSDDDWLLSLRAICTSVINHRKQNAGAFSYLTSARNFVAKANSLRQ